MQVPTRRSDKIPRPQADPVMTAAKFAELKTKLQKWKTVNRPREAAEVARLALMGDFSENVGYQVAKGRLRGLNQRITDLQNLLARAEIIETGGANGQVGLGNLVTIEKLKDGQTKTYRILGAAETNPGAGVISHSSPLGAALLNRHLDDIIEIKINGQTVRYKIIKIE